MDAQFFKRRPVYPVDDLAYDFVEHELGRHDWANNWRSVRAQPDIQARVETWLDRIQVQADPQEIISFLDRMVRTRVGRWR